MKKRMKISQYEKIFALFFEETRISRIVIGFLICDTRTIISLAGFHPADTGQISCVTPK